MDWINPISWDLNLVNKLKKVGWSHFQVDCEGGCVDERYLQAMTMLEQHGVLNPIFRIPPNGAYLFDKIKKFGGRNYLISGGYTLEFIEYISSSLTDHGETKTGIYVMLESRADFSLIESIAKMPNVFGFHFGLVDLSKDFRIEDWRDVSAWPDRLASVVSTVRAHGKTVGSYFLPEWKNSVFQDQLNVRSFSADEFCKP
ncbi:hypothetical protein [Ottowia thiooxydans]|uniref:hypothetical protein n=1 Tax=Ottowia thiooxydans TaxID=219182 RepID=UPI00041C338B|nr:hypothetical protein [Ottowia thiooxydans]